MASGTITNNLRDWQQARHGDGVDTSDAQRFSDWVAEQLSLGFTEAADGLRAIAGGCAPPLRLGFGRCPYVPAGCRLNQYEAAGPAAGQDQPDRAEGYGKQQTQAQRQLRQPVARTNGQPPMSSKRRLPANANAFVNLGGSEEGEKTRRGYAAQNLLPS